MDASDGCMPEATPVLHSCYDAMRGTKVPGEASAQRREKRTNNAERGVVRARGGGARGSIGGWKLLTSYGKVNQSSGGDANSWMACMLPFPFDTVHCP